MAVQAPKGAPKNAGGSGPAPADPTGQIDQGMAATQDFQNKSNTRQSMWQAVMAVDEKAWKVLEGIIQDLKS